MRCAANESAADSRYGCSVDDHDDGNIEYEDDDDEEEAPATRWSGVAGMGGWDVCECARI